MRSLGSYAVIGYRVIPGQNVTLFSNLTPSGHRFFLNFAYGYFMEKFYIPFFHFLISAIFYEVWHCGTIFVFAIFLNVP